MTEKQKRTPTEVTLRIRAMAKVERLKAKIRDHESYVERWKTDLHMAVKEYRVLCGDSAADPARPSVGGPADA